MSEGSLVAEVRTCWRVGVEWMKRERVGTRWEAVSGLGGGFERAREGLKERPTRERSMEDGAGYVEEEGSR